MGRLHKYKLLLENMENYYDILGCTMDSTHHEIKHSYQKLALKYHPDKHAQNEELPHDAANDYSSLFIKLQKAWEILGNPETRNEFNARWKDHCIAQDWPVQEELDISDFDFDEDSECYIYGCRCGSDYVLTTKDVFFKMDYVSCDICSLCVKVEYKDTFVEDTTIKPEGS